MNLCPITYENCGERLYSEKGLKLLSPALKNLAPLDYNDEELREEAMYRATKMSIQGVQPKLSAVLNIKEGRFEIVDKKGRYIIKPQHQALAELPENEDLTMRLASLIGIEVPVHGLIYTKENSFAYFIKRFDRKGQIDKIQVEDFAQLAGLSRETKYNFSMEKLVKILDDFCTFPAIEKLKLFKIVLFNFLIGNEDMHLKNYSVIVNNGKVELSPSYDLLNTTVLFKGEIEEIALPIRGKKKKLSRELLLNYFGKDRCGLTDKTIEKILNTITLAIQEWFRLIDVSFLSNQMKQKYKLILENRIKTLFINNLSI